MAVTWANRVKETTTTTGTGALTLLGAATGGFFAFSTIGDGKTCKYTIDDGAGNVEVGQGTYTLSSNSLSRDSIETSTNSNALVNFGAGTKTVFIDITAAAISSFGSSPANPTASIGLSAVNGVATTFMRSDAAPALDQSIAPTWTGVHTFAPAIRSATSVPYWGLQTPADTALPTGIEAIGAYIGGDASHASVTRTWAGSTTIASQREICVIAPTYNFASAGTITTCTTFDISGPPNAGPNVTIPLIVNVFKNYALTIGGSAAPWVSLSTGSRTGTPFGQTGVQVPFGQAVLREASLYGYTTNDGGSIDNPFSYFYFNCPEGSTSGSGMAGIIINPPTTQIANALGLQIQLRKDPVGSGNQTGSFNQFGLSSVITTGYSGTGGVACVRALTTTMSTGNAFIPSNGTPSGNMGLFGAASGTTTGNNHGVAGAASGGGVSYGVAGYATTNAVSKSNIGVAGFGLNGGATPAAQCGGYFALRNAYPIFTSSFSAALTADNGSTSLPVFIGMVNGTTQFQVDAHGNVICTQLAQNAVTPSPILTITGAANTNLTASQEFTAINFDLATNRQQFAAGALSSNRWVRFQGPTINFVAASTLTQSSTLDITAASAGTNCTLTYPYSITVTGAIGCSAVSGTNVAGNTLTLIGGLSTGSGNGGNVVIQTSVPGSSGIAINAPTNMLTINGATGAVGIGDVSSAYGGSIVNVYTGSGFSGSAVQIHSTATTSAGTQPFQLLSSGVQVCGITGSGCFLSMSGTRPGIAFNNVGGTNYTVIAGLTSSPSTSFLGYAASPTSTTITPVVQWDENANAVLGKQGALATNAVNGFVYIPSCAGAPTGVPTSFSGMIPLIYDTTDNKLYAYNGAWKSVLLA